MAELTCGPVEGNLPINEENYPMIRINVQPHNPDRNHKFIFLEEGKFSFCTAFASKRRGWQGIVATGYYNNYDDREARTLPQAAAEGGAEQRIREWETTILECIGREIPNGEDRKSLVSLGFGDNRNSLPVRLHLEATAMGKRKQLCRIVGIEDPNPIITLWFQCPWTSDYIKYPIQGGNNSQQVFLEAVFRAAAGVQVDGELFAIGVCVDSDLGGGSEYGPYVNRYGPLQSMAREAGYACLGADKSFIGEMIGRGYEHASNMEGNLLKDPSQFATLLFKRSLDRMFLDYEFYLFYDCQDGKLLLCHTGCNPVIKEIPADEFLKIKKAEASALPELISTSVIGAAKCQTCSKPLQNFDAHKWMQEGGKEKIDKIIAAEASRQLQLMSLGK